MSETEQHVVITTKLEVLRYPTIAKAKAMYVDTSVVYTSVKDLIERLSSHNMLILLRRFSTDKVHGKLKDSERIAKELWPLLLRNAKIENPWAPKPMPGTKSFEKAYTQIIVSPLYREYKRDRWSKGIPPQAEILMDYFQENISDEGVTEQQLEVLVRQCHAEGLLKTKQDPFRIYQYYRAMLFSRGFPTTMYDKVAHVQAEKGVH